MGLACAEASPTYSLTEPDGQQVHVLPLDAEANITPPNLIARSAAAGESIIVSEVRRSAGSLNRDLLSPVKRLWSSDVGMLEDRSNAGIELIKGWPTETEVDLADWFKMTGSLPDTGQAGFWNYTVEELGTPEVATPMAAIPLPGAVQGSLGTIVIAGAAWLLNAVRRRR